MDTKLGFSVGRISAEPVRVAAIAEKRKTLDEHVQDIKNLTFKIGGKVKHEIRFEDGGKPKEIELTLNFKVH
jgi:hypothetical protein